MSENNLQLAVLNGAASIKPITATGAVELLGLDSKYVQQPTSADSGKYAKATANGVEWSELPTMLELAGATDLPADLASAAAVGTSTKAAKADHRHRYQSAINTNFNAGESSQSILSAVERSYDFLGVNRLAFLKPEQITIEHSTDGGETWTDSGYTAEEKANLFIKGGIGVVKIGPKNQTSALVGYQTRVTLTSTSGTDAAYGSYDWVNILISGTYATGGQAKCDLSVANGIDTDTFVAVTANTIINWQGGTGFLGVNSIHFPPRMLFAPAGTPYIYKFRLTFKISAEPSSGTFSPTIKGIQGFSDRHVNPERSYMATTGHLYDYDYLQNAIFPANVTATKFIGNGSQLTNLPAANLTGTVPIANGGTGATTAAGALQALTGLATTAGLPYYNANGTMSLATDANVRSALSGGTTGQVLKHGTAGAEWHSFIASDINAVSTYLGIQNSASTTSFIVDTLVTASANAYCLISLITYSRDETPSLCNISVTCPASDAGTAFQRVDVSGVYGDFPTVVKAFKAANGKVGVFVQFGTAKLRIMAKVMTSNTADNLVSAVTVAASVPTDATLVTAATVTNRNLSQLDISTANPVANGSPFAGVTGKVADAGHVHPISTFQELGINDASIRGVLTGGNVGDVLGYGGANGAKWTSIKYLAPFAKNIGATSFAFVVQTSIAHTTGSRTFGAIRVIALSEKANSFSEFVVRYDANAVSGTDTFATVELDAISGVTPTNAYIYTDTANKICLWLNFEERKRYVYAWAYAGSSYDHNNIDDIVIGTEVQTKPTTGVTFGADITDFKTKQASITASDGQIIVKDSGTIKGANTIASSKVSGLGTLATKSNITPADFADPGSAGKVLASQTASNGDFEAAWKTLAVSDISGLQTALSGKQDSITSSDGQIIVNDNGTLKGVNEIPYTSVDGLGALATLDTVTYNKITPSGTVGQVLITRPSGSSRATAWDTLDANDIQALSGTETPAAGSLAEQLANLADAEHNHNEVITITNAAGAVQTAANTQFQSIFGSTSGGINSYTSTKKVTLLLAGIASTTEITLPAVADKGAVVEILYVGTGTPASVKYTVKGGVNNEIYVAADNTTANVSDGAECLAGVKEVFTHVSETRWVCTHEALLTTISSGGGGTAGGATLTRNAVRLTNTIAANAAYSVTYSAGDTYIYVKIGASDSGNRFVDLPASPADGTLVKVSFLNAVANASNDDATITVRAASSIIYTDADAATNTVALHKKGYFVSGGFTFLPSSVELIFKNNYWYANLDA